MKWVIDTEFLLAKLKIMYRRLSPESESYQPFHCFYPALLRYSITNDPDNADIDELISEIGRMNLSFSDADSFITEAVTEIIQTIKRRIGTRNFKRIVDWKLSNDYRSIILSDELRI